MKNFEHNPILQAIFAPEAPPAGDKPMLENAGDRKPKVPTTESMETMMLEAVASRASGDLRALAASMIATWVSDGEPDADSFDALAMSMAGLDDMDDDEDPTDEQADDYNEALSALADAAVALGADQDDVTDMIDDFDDEAAQRVCDAIEESDEAMLEEAVAVYAVAGGDEPMLEAVRKKVVRGGKVKIIKKRPRPRRLNSLQKQALKKARRKAHTSVAKLHRKKSMKLRQKRGLK